MHDQVLTAAAAGVASAIAAAIARWGGRHALHRIRGAAQLLREFQEFRESRAGGGSGPAGPAGSGPES